MFLNNFFKKLADFADKYHGNGDDFRKMIVKPELTAEQEDHDKMIENEIDDAIEAKHQKNESDFDKYKGELDWDRPEE